MRGCPIPFGTQQLSVHNALEVVGITSPSAWNGVYDKCDDWNNGPSWMHRDYPVGPYIFRADTNHFFIMQSRQIQEPVITAFKNMTVGAFTGPYIGLTPFTGNAFVTRWAG